MDTYRETLTGGNEMTNQVIHLFYTNHSTHTACNRKATLGYKLTLNKNEVTCRQCQIDDMDPAGAGRRAAKAEAIAAGF